MTSSYKSLFLFNGATIKEEIFDIPHKINSPIKCEQNNYKIKYFILNLLIKFIHTKLFGFMCYYYIIYKLKSQLILTIKYFYFFVFKLSFISIYNFFK